MSVVSVTPETSDPRIAVAETWLCMVGGLREIAKRFSRFLVHEMRPAGPCPNGRVLAFRIERNLGAALKRVTLALRFAALLYLKIEKQIAAWKAGAAFDLDAFMAEAPRMSAPGRSRAAAADSDKPDWDEEEWEDLDEYENFIERDAPERYDFLEGWGRDPQEDRYQALLRGPLKDAIAALCADLGLSPDWSLWTDKGFPPPRAGELEDWVVFFRPEAVFAPRPGPDGSPVDDAAYTYWRWKWYPPRGAPPGAPPPYPLSAGRPPRLGASP